MKTTLKFGILFLACLTASCLNLHLAEGTPLGHETASQKTPQFGISSHGYSFEWTTSLQNADIREVSGRDGSYIDQIKVRTEDGAHEETSPSFGGNGGGAYTWKVPDGEYIAKIEYRQGDWLDGITFITSKGTRSPQFGGHGGGGPFTYTLPVGAKLNGFYGHKDPYIKGLGFTYKVHSSPEFGNNIIGSPFSWMSSLYNAEIREVIGMDGWQIDQIKVKTSDGAHEETSPSFGGSGGFLFRWTVPDGEYIAKVEFIEGQWFGVTFVTDLGTRSPQIGGHGGSTPSTYVVPNGNRLAGIFGHSDKLVRGLGFYLAPAVPGRTIRKLPLYGNYKYGYKFEWMGDKNANLEKIEGNKGSVMNKIKFTLTNGEVSPFFVIHQNEDKEYVVPAGQHIVSVTFNTNQFGSLLHSVYFKTNKGQQFKIGTSQGQKVYTENIPEGTNIVGLYGSYTTYYFYSLGLIIAEYL